MIQDIEDIVQQSLPNPDYFVLSLDQDSTGVIRLIADHTDGIGIDDIVVLSRAINREIHERHGEEADFQLEVMSPGADMPLTDLRQLKRHIDRTLDIEPSEGKPFTAQLLSVGEDSFRVVEKRLPTKQQPKAKLGKEMELRLDETNSVKVVIEFK